MESKENIQVRIYFVFQLIPRDTIVGTYEGKFFNRAMDIFRDRYNTADQVGGQHRTLGR